MVGGWPIATGATMSGKTFETYWPYAFSLVFTFVWWRYLGVVFPSNASALIGATGTVSAVIVGFLVTAKAIVVGLTGTPVFKILVKTGYSGLFYRYILEAEIGGLSLLIISIVGFFVLSDSGLSPLSYKIIWIFVAVLSICLFVRVLYMLFLFLNKAE